jgi:DNA-binding protein HU-beta
VARNPKTNQEVTVPAQRVPVLKISKEFRQAVQKGVS